MVWIQVWSDPNEFIRSEKITSVSYRMAKTAAGQDWIEVVAEPMGRVILQASVRAGEIPRAGPGQKSWLRLVDARARLVMREVIRIISDKEQRAKMVSLHDLVIPDFEQEVPDNLSIEIQVWNIPCHHCHKETPVVYPVGAFFGYMLEFNFLSNLPRMLAEKYPFFKKAPAQETDAGEYRNTCVHCGEPQPDWCVMESYLEITNTPSLVTEKAQITVPLTDDEKAEYRKAGITPGW